jgi:hypothetical protein
MEAKNAIKWRNLKGFEGLEVGVWFCLFLLIIILYIIIN